ncbi:MAG: hypothetical protein JWL73_1585, partial [Actinomycetia bacterium]|nr:hypothetical protein [Actinomycetes bacterium]
MTPERDVEQNLGAQTMRSGTGRRVPWVAAAVVVLILAASTFAVRSRSGSDSQVASAAAAKSTTTTTNPLQSAFVSVVNRVRPSIVEVETPTGLGSGVVYDNKGDIVTNNHVVEGSTSFQVNLANGKTLNGT